MSSYRVTYVQGALLFVLVILICYASIEVFNSPLNIFAHRVQQYDSHWKGWAGIEKIFSFGDSYTATNFDVTKQQPGPGNPFGNPTYNLDSPYIKWIHYLTTVYNDSKIETYNFAVHGATVDKALIDRGSALSTQTETRFLPNYVHHPVNSSVDDNDRNQRRRWLKRWKRDDNKSKPPLAEWNPETTLFSVWFGINDVVFSNKSEVLFDRVFESYRSTLYKLHTAGARNFLLLNVPPIHRSPTQPPHSILSTTIPSWNARLATLAADLGALTAESSSSSSVFLFDTFDLFNRILDHPADFNQTRHLVNLEDQCDEYVHGVKSQQAYARECGVPYDQYFWRDGLHVTFPVHEALADGVAGLLRGW